MKRLGIIGGLGPMATAYFLRLIVEMTEAKTDQEHIEVLLHSKPQIPDRTRFILGLSSDNPMPELLNTGKSLVEQGAEVLAIPCITAHFFQKELEAGMGCPIINAIEETAKYLQTEKISRVGILATEGTLQSRLFQNTLNQYDINCFVPEKEGQQEVMHIIYDNVKAGKPIEMKIFHDVSEKLFCDGAQIILLGCTELSMVKRDFHISNGYLDVMEVLARAAVMDCGKLKERYNRMI